ncbi:phosphate ABC transporter substrate-binding protein, PhoT family (TC 3.A.1.7.1) [Geosporobacter subterraneus DSM 17957]|uniref:Phosphate-binding protein n=1 Tax=Geosporobacter subterraneus DSM 17957 TaxID=1121919 RepID=A0A1M6GF99_9FIRM|nr:PstS family phosphate ABC transporter substrate-binding protein [Geosporobacter subterraneus]SHJ08609.1 phosphate ABC transporter substrate-binding protein, PhoT family (TC 3.A.1.7.1) [Geosporobacter subterraneus DSM 17957]
MKLFKNKFSILAMILVISMIALAGCGSKPAGQTAQEPAKEEVKLSGEIKIDGSSTVFPITEAIAEEFRAVYPDVKIPVGVSGTGGGFKKFVAKETDINDASRPIKSQEAADAASAGVEYVELKVAFDGLSVLVNPSNTWVDYLTVDELKKIWAPDSTVKTWKDVRAEWPAEEIKLYAPGTDSGTFDYFTEEINGKSGAIRPDFIGSEDDNVLVQGIAGDKNALGFFGFAYYEENKDKLKVVKIDNGNGAIEPTFDTIKDGSYAPLSRPLFIYVNKASLEKPEVKEFVTFYLETAKDIVKEVGYVALPDEEYAAGLNKIK